MCICDCFSIIGGFIGEILYSFQKICQCVTIGSVLTCLVCTFTIILMMGVGLGYNHCFLEFKGKKGAGRTDFDEKEANNDLLLEDEAYDEDETFNGPAETWKYVSKTLENEKNKMELRKSRSANGPIETATRDYPLPSTILIPLLRPKKILNLIKLIKKQKLNVTLEIISK